MGIGGAFIMPATLSFITNVFPPEERGRAISYWAAIAGVGVALGPISGGLLLEHFYWGSIFLVNLPIVAVALVGGAYLLPKSRDPSHPRLDLVGASLSIVGSALARVRHHRRPDRRVGRAPRSSASFAIAAVVLVRVRVVGAASRAIPMLNLQVFENPRFSAASLGHHADLLRDVRLDVPAHAVPPEHHGLLGAARPAPRCCRGRRSCSWSRR